MACHLEIFSTPWPSTCFGALPSWCTIEVAALLAFTEEAAIHDAPRMAMHLGHFTVISLADYVITLDSVLPVCQGGHNVSEASPFLTGLMWPRNHTERYERKLQGGAKHLRDLRAQKTFEQDKDSGYVFSGSLASPVKGDIESRRMHQMHLVKLGAGVRL